ncbi:MAG: NUDIX hydrolase [Clostridia bacterium]|nr:NUDIX hydrolase [Clostridia bacterium]
MKLKNVKKLTNERFLNMFDLEYEHNGDIIHWTLASRNSAEDLVSVTGKEKIDTVCIIPKVVKNGKDCVILTKEFRQPINDYVYSFPAGIVEKGEDVFECCARELKEEIGADEISQVTKLTDICYNSEGMTDESVMMFEVVISKLGKQNLQDHEDIKVFIIPVEDLEKFTKGKKLSTKAGIYCPMITREYELKKQIESLKNPTEMGSGE